jgi:hypothetical protein
MAGTESTPRTSPERVGLGWPRTMDVPRETSSDVREAGLGWPATQRRQDEVSE